MLDDILRDPEFQKLDREKKKKVAEGFFEEHIASDPEFQKLDKEKQKIVKNRLYEEFGAAETPERTVKGTLKDIAGTAAKGIVGLGEGVVGLMDIGSLGVIGKGLEAVGYDPQHTRQFIERYLSSERQQFERRGAARDVRVGTGPDAGILDESLAYLKAYGKRPSLIAEQVGESLPSIYGGGAMSRMAGPALRGAGAAIETVAPRLAQFLSKAAGFVARHPGGVGEGLITAGQTAESIRQETETGLLTPGQVGAAVGAGTLTGLLGELGGRLARRLGVEDIDVIAGGGKPGEGTRNILSRMIRGGISEGIFEELPQSIQEQVFTNAALGRPLTEGIGEAAALGALSGGAMGAGFNLLRGGRRSEYEQAVQQKPEPEQQQIKTLSQIVDHMLLTEPADEREAQERASAISAIFDNPKTPPIIKQYIVDSGLAEQLGIKPEETPPPGADLVQAEEFFKDKSAGRIEELVLGRTRDYASSKRKAEILKEQISKGFDLTTPEGRQAYIDSLYPPEKEASPIPEPQPTQPVQPERRLSPEIQRRIENMVMRRASTYRDARQAIKALRQEAAKFDLTKPGGRQAYIDSLFPRQEPEAKGEKPDEGLVQALSLEFEEGGMPPEISDRLAEVLFTRKSAYVGGRKAIEAIRSKLGQFDLSTPEGRQAYIDAVMPEEVPQRRTDGRPWKSRKQAETAMRNRGLAKTHQVVKAPDGEGYILEPKVPIRKEPTSAPTPEAEQVGEPKPAKAAKAEKAPEPKEGRGLTLTDWLKKVQATGAVRVGATDIKVVQNEDGQYEVVKTRKGKRKTLDTFEEIGLAQKSAALHAFREAKKGHDTEDIERVGSPEREERKEAGRPVQEPSAGREETQAGGVVQEPQKEEKPAPKTVGVEERRKSGEATEKSTKIEKKPSFVQKRPQKEGVNVTKEGKKSNQAAKSLTTESSLEEINKVYGEHGLSVAWVLPKKAYAITEKDGDPTKVFWIHDKEKLVRDVEGNIEFFKEARAANDLDTYIQESPEIQQLKKDIERLKKKIESSSGEERKAAELELRKLRRKVPEIYDEVEKRFVAEKKGEKSEEREKGERPSTSQKQETLESPLSAPSPITAFRKAAKLRKYSKGKAELTNVFPSIGDGRLTLSDVPKDSKHDFIGDSAVLIDLRAIPDDQIRTTLRDIYGAVRSGVKVPYEVALDLFTKSTPVPLTYLGSKKGQAIFGTPDGQIVSVIEDTVIPWVDRGYQVHVGEPKHTGLATDFIKIVDPESSKTVAVFIGHEYHYGSDGKRVQFVDELPAYEAWRKYLNERRTAGKTERDLDKSSSKGSTRRGRTTQPRQGRKPGTRSHGTGRPDVDIGSIEGGGDLRSPQRDVAGDTVRVTPDAPTTGTPGNFKFTPEIAEQLQKRTSTQRIKDNLKALKVLKGLLDEDGNLIRKANAEEQAVLALYSGWGGLNSVFNEKDQKTAKIRNELKELLTEEEFAAARSGSRTAFYTSPKIITGMYRTLAQLGANGRLNILEPSAGTGNFIGMRGEEFEDAVFTAVEIDPIPAKIAQLLYPKAVVLNSGFEDVKGLKDFDLVVGNPPFSEVKPFDPDFKPKDGKGRQLKFSLHNFIFAKSIKALRPGGVSAMIVSHYLLDSRDPAARTWMATQAEFLGAVRLPSTAFKGSTQTEVVTDIVFLKKRQEPISWEEAVKERWVQVEPIPDPDGGKDIPINGWMKDNADWAIIGQMVRRGSMYGPDEPTVVPPEGVAIEDELPKRLEKLTLAAPSAFDPPVKQRPEGQTHPADEAFGNVPVPDHVPVYGFFIHKGKLYQRKENNSLGQAVAGPPARWHQGEGKHVKLGASQIKKAMLLTKMKETRRELIAAEREGRPKAEIERLRKILNKDYDSFYKKYGPINKVGNKQVYNADPELFKLLALEKDFDPGLTAAQAKKLGTSPRKPAAQKADIFFRPVAKKHVEITSVNSAKQGLIVSLNRTGQVDLDYISRLYHKPITDIIDELGDLIYKDPAKGWVTADEYLSGNVKEKLHEAKRAAMQEPDVYNRNVEALEAVQPEPVEAKDITVRPTASWIPPKIHSDFAADFFKASGFEIKYSDITGRWLIQKDSQAFGDNDTRYGVPGIMSGFEIYKRILTGKSLTVWRRTADDRRVVDVDATMQVQTKAEQLIDAFKKWIWSGPGSEDRIAKLVPIYNDLFNVYRERKWDGSHLTFDTMNQAYRLRPHQANAVWRSLVEGRLLYDHSVGTGKTFTMVATAIEGKRMGLWKKPMITVPNGIVEQFGAEAADLYPQANILVATKSDFVGSKRRLLFAKIANGDWDLVILPHSSFGLVSIPAKAHAEFIQEQIEEFEKALREAKAVEGRPDRNLVRSIENTREKLRNRLREVESKQETTIDLDELGIDTLFVDEAHNFKNLAFPTKHGRIAGLGNTGFVKKAYDMFVKVRYLQKQHGGRNTFFATGTPISNSISEMYNMMRFMDFDTMKQRRMAHFDSWIDTFAEAVTEIDIDATGVRYSSQTKFQQFINLPELMDWYRSFADVVLLDDLQRQAIKEGKKWPVPKIKGGKPEIVVVPRSPLQAAYMDHVIWRADHMPPDKREDNMLKLTTDALKAALDMRLIDPRAADVPYGKVNTAVNRIFDIYKKWDSKKGAQLVFLDSSVPTKAKTKERKQIEKLIEQTRSDDPEIALKAQEKLDELGPAYVEATLSDFSLYDDIKKKLVKKGVPAHQIAFIHDADSEAKRRKLFADVRSGKVRILIGNTPRMGEGMNVQKRLVALHHLDAPWKPSQLEQREGRIIRQGNMFYEADPDGFEIEILRYATKETYDTRRWKIIQDKARIVSQIRKAGRDTRAVQDIADEAANAAEMKAAASGNPLIMEEVEIRQKIRKMQAERDGHYASIIAAKQRLSTLKNTLIPGMERALEFQKEIKKRADEFLGRDFVATINGQVFDSHKQAGEALKAYIETGLQAIGARKFFTAGEYKGGEIIAREGYDKSVEIIYVPEGYTLADVKDLYLLPSWFLDRKSLSGSGIITRIDNYHKAADGNLRQIKQKLEKYRFEFENKKGLEDKPWPKEEEFQRLVEYHRELQARVSEITVALNPEDIERWREMLDAPPEVQLGLEDETEIKFRRSEKLERVVARTKDHDPDQRVKAELSAVIGRGTLNKWLKSGKVKIISKREAERILRPVLRPEEPVLLSQKPKKYKAEGGEAKWIEWADNGKWIDFGKLKTLDDVREAARQDFEKLAKAGPVLSDVEGYVRAQLRANAGNPQIQQLRRQYNDDVDAISKAFLEEMWRLHQEALDQAAEYLKMGYGHDPMFQNSMLRAVRSVMSKKGLTAPPTLHGVPLAEVYQKWQAGEYTGVKAMIRDYIKRAAEWGDKSDVAEERFEGLKGGRWVKLPQVTPEMSDQEREEVFSFWAAMSRNNWCTSAGMQRVYAEKGPMWVYRKNGESLVAIRFEGDEVAEIQSESNDGTIPPEYIKEVEHFTQKAKLSDYARLTISKAKRDATVLDYIERNARGPWEGKWRPLKDGTWAYRGNVTLRQGLGEEVDFEGFDAFVPAADLEKEKERLRKESILAQRPISVVLGGFTDDSSTDFPTVKALKMVSGNVFIPARATMLPDGRLIYKGKTYKSLEFVGGKMEMEGPHRFPRLLEVAGDLTYSPLRGQKQKHDAFPLLQRVGGNISAQRMQFPSLEEMGTSGISTLYFAIRDCDLGAENIVAHGDLKLLGKEGVASAKTISADSLYIGNSLPFLERVEVAKFDVSGADLPLLSEIQWKENAKEKRFTLQDYRTLGKSFFSNLKSLTKIDGAHSVTLDIAAGDNVDPLPNLKTISAQEAIDITFRETDSAISYSTKYWPTLSNLEKVSAPRIDINPAVRLSNLKIIEANNLHLDLPQDLQWGVKRVAGTEENIYVQLPELEKIATLPGQAGDADAGFFIGSIEAPKLRIITANPTTQLPVLHFADVTPRLPGLEFVHGTLSAMNPDNVGNLKAVTAFTEATQRIFKEKKTILTGQDAIEYGEKIGAFDDFRKDTAKFSVSDLSRVEGFTAPDGTAYLVADNIDPGQAYRVFLHEVGVHVTRLGFKSTRDFKRVLDAILRKADGKGKEAEEIREALRRVPKDTPDAIKAEEALAYLIDRGRTHYSTVRRFLAALKKFLVETLRFPAEILTTDDLRMIAQGVLLKPDLFASEGLSNRLDLVQNAFSDTWARFQAVTKEIIESPAFKKWFAGSKIKRHGKPLVMYHGTSDPKFWAFDERKLGKNTGHITTNLGFFFTPFKKHAQAYGDRVLKVFLRIENPYITTGEKLADMLDSHEAARKFRDDLIAKGYDGIVWKDGTTIAFHANQIKSAEINTGQFLNTEADIRYSVKTPVNEAAEKEAEEVDKAYLEAIDTAKALIKQVNPWAKDKYTMEGPPDTNLLDRLFALPSHYFEKVPALKRVYEAAMRGRDRYHELVNSLTMRHDGNYRTVILNTLEKEKPQSFKKVQNYLINQDVAEIGWKVKYDETENVYRLYSPYQKKPTGTFFYEDMAWGAAIDQEVDYLIKKKGWTPEEAEAVRAFREATHAGFELLTRQLKEIIDYYKKNGLTLEENITLTDKEGNRFKGTLRDALAMMGDLRGFYFPRIHKPGAYAVYARHPEKGNKLWKYDVKKLAEAKAAALKKRGWEVTVRPAGPLPEEVFDLPEKVAKVNAIISEALKRVEKGELEDVPGLSVERRGDELIIAGPSSKVLNDIFKSFGGRFYNRDNAWHFRKISKKDEGRLRRGILAHEHMIDNETQALIGGMLSESIANVFKERGGRARMIRRNRKEVWKGYEENPAIALARYVSGIAATEAKRQTALDMLLSFTGRDISWQAFEQIWSGAFTPTSLVERSWIKDVEAFKAGLSREEQELPPDYLHYLQFQRRRGVDAMAQKNAYEDGIQYMKAVLRNKEQADRLFGIISGLAMLKYLGGRASSVFVNLTALFTNAPAAISGYSKASLWKSAKLLSSAIHKSYLYWRYKRTGKRAAKLSVEDIRAFEYMELKGWTADQYNREAMGALISKLGQFYATLVEKAMWGFRVSEMLNRYATIHAAYQAVKNDSEYQGDFEAAMLRAREISDKAHGVYGKTNKPAMVQKSRLLQALYVFQTFIHNYWNTLYDLGVSKKQFKAAAWLAIAPSLLGGATVGASGAVFKAFLMALGKAIGSDDPEEEFYEWLYNTFGPAGPTMEALARYGIFGLAVDLSGSLDATPRVPRKASDWLGAPGAVFFDVWHGAQDVARGDIMRGFERILPLAIASPIKAWREYTQGVTTRENVPIFDSYGRPLKLETYEALFEAAGFQPVRKAKVREINWKDRKILREYSERRWEIYSRIRAAYLEGRGVIAPDEWAEIMAEIARYNQMAVRSKRRVPLITWRSIRQAIKRISTYRPMRKVAVAAQ